MHVESWYEHVWGRRDIHSWSYEHTNVQTYMYVKGSSHLQHFSSLLTHMHHCTYMHTSTQMRKLGLGEEVKELGEAELEALDKKTVEYEITVLEEQLKQMTPNMAAIEEYRRKVCVCLCVYKRVGACVCD